VGGRIATEIGETLRYQRPEGEGRFGVLSPRRELVTTAKLSTGAQLIDVEGDGCLEDCWIESQFSEATIAYYSTMANCRAQVMASPLLTGPETCELPLDSYPAARCCCGPV